MNEPYICKEHGFVTLDPRAATKHIQGHIVDLLMANAAKVIKAQLRIPQTDQFCNCGWLPYPHKHAPVTSVVI